MRKYFYSKFRHSLPDLRNALANFIELPLLAIAAKKKILYEHVIAFGVLSAAVC